ncbi:MAG: hypothetical protein KDM64_18055, partial [Verrucomicrobiae bacterium]|nr:hypothetical protein [Verrucomicrobiae bacterium]
PGDVTVFSGDDGDEFFFTFGGGVRQTAFQVETRPMPLTGVLGGQPSGISPLPFRGNPDWKMQAPEQFPRSRVTADGDRLTIDPRMDLERNDRDYRELLDILRNFGGLRGYQTDPIGNYALEQHLHLDPREYRYEEDLSQGSLMFGYRFACPDPADRGVGGFFGQAGLSFVWGEGVSFATPMQPAWSNDVTVNFNPEINRLRPQLAEMLQPVDRIRVTGYQWAHLDLDSQTLAVMLGGGYQFGCGCRIALTLLAGWRFQQWELMERQRVVANGRTVLDAERRDSGRDAIPMLSGMIEAGYPLTDQIEVIIYGGTALSVGGNEGLIQGDTILIQPSDRPEDNRFVGGGLSIHF